jgi:uncharacterized protein (TIGR00725 family)
MAHRAARPHIAVIGSSEASEAQLEQARAVGLALAKAGAVLICGGLGGVMLGACEGARTGGGTTVAILPGSDRSSANPYVDVAIATGMGELRNGLIVRAADALIAIGGGWGTLSEIAFAMRTGRPLVALEDHGLPAAHGHTIEVFPDPQRAVDRALSLAGAR